MNGNLAVAAVTNIELTIARAAGLPCASEEYPDDLFDSGQVAYRQLGKYRMVRPDSLLEYDRENSVHRRAALIELMGMPQEIGIHG